MVIFKCFAFLVYTVREWRSVKAFFKKKKKKNQCEIDIGRNIFVVVAFVTVVRTRVETCLVFFKSNNSKFLTSHSSFYDTNLAKMRCA